MSLRLVHTVILEVYSMAMKRKPETVDEMVIELFKAYKGENKLHILYLEARLHREAGWIVPIRYNCE
jgi:hypothetical protein